ncbi:hypothetical protein FVEG_15728 [Fusarium verticillioides 7600]|uniref:Uncharacterized protein n=1 Tax=Gibberella moniliformis (strain M3125 / FGSC 7600) TaxID=334819 RepID=W7MBB7_GIBM7|nr:hypothetical protein FVEG_15728 [Fusarium verticillioides 7600]EWG44814.1 hypothetical protein FVEG_15728 [Fusarium verticillioides 7600]
MLRTASRHFRTVIAITVDDVLAAERASALRGIDLLGCYDCLCLRKAECLVDSTRRGKTGRWGSKPTSRFCIDCGLHPHSGTTRYNCANKIGIGGEVFVKCWCGKGCILHTDSSSENRRVCMTCWKPVAQRRRQRQQEQQNLQRRQEKTAKAKDRAERRARYHDRGRAESDIGSLISGTTISDNDSDYDWV